MREKLQIVALGVCCPEHLNHHELSGSGSGGLHCSGQHQALLPDPSNERASKVSFLFSLRDDNILQMSMKYISVVMQDL